MQAMAAIGAFASSAAGVGAIAAVSTGLGVFGNIQAGQVERDSLSFQEAIAKRNQMIEEDNARFIRGAGAVEAAQRDFEAADVLSREFTSQASSGFRVLSPSFQRRIKRGQLGAQQDRIRTVQDAERQARSAENSASGYGMESQQARAAKKNVGLKTFLGVGDSLIGGARLASDLTSRRISNSARSVD